MNKYNYGPIFASAIVCYNAIFIGVIIGNLFNEISYTILAMLFTIVNTAILISLVLDSNNQEVKK